MNSNILQFTKPPVKTEYPRSVEEEQILKDWMNHCADALRRNPLVCHVAVTTWKEMEDFAIKEGILPQPEVKMPDGVTHENFASKLDQLLTNLKQKD